MVVRCSACGKENLPGARFCGSCGSSLAEAPREEGVPPSEAPTVVLPKTVPPMAQAPYQPPPFPSPPRRTPTAPLPMAQAPFPGTVPPQPAPQSRPSPQPSYMQAQYPSPFAPATYPVPATARRRSSVYYAGAAVALICGILIVASSFMGWFGFGGYYASGWDIMRGMRESGRNPFVNADEGVSGAKLVFSGLCTLIAGALLALLALIAIPAASRGMGALLLVISLLALAMAGINSYSFLSLRMGISMGAGMVILIASSFLGTVGGLMTLAG